MIRHYQTLFQLDLRHLFYTDAHARELALVPTSHTSQLLKKNGFQWVIRPKDFLLVYVQEEVSVANQPPAVFSFILRSSSPYFQHFTELPFFKPGEKILYFNNLQVASQQGALSQQADVGTDDILPLYGAYFHFDSHTGNINALYNGLQEVVPAVSEDNTWWYPANPADKNAGFKVNLSGLPPGKYGLELAPNDIEWFYCAGPDIRPGDLGVVEIYCGGQPNMTPWPGGAPQPAHAFHLNFRARSTLWRYYVINQNKVSFDELSIDDGLGFTLGEATLLRSGAHEAVPLVSNKPLPLQEHPSERPQLKLLKNKLNGNDNNVFASIDLPIPDWRSITPESQGAELYSDMYIYL